MSLRLGFHGRIYCPGLPLDPDAVCPALRDVIRDVASAKAPWPLVMLGGVGVGKTFAAVDLLDRVGGGCRYYGLGEMCDELILAGKGELWWGGDRITTSGFWHDWRKRLCVVVDEIGARQNVSDFHYETLKRALDERERVSGPLVCISNLDLDGLARTYDDRIASRLAAGTVVALTAEDRRVEPSPLADPDDDDDMDDLDIPPRTPEELEREWRRVGSVFRKHGQPIPDPRAVKGFEAIAEKLANVAGRPEHDGQGD